MVKEIPAGPDSRMGAPSPLRHLPVQERGRRRVNQLLDTAAKLIAEVGVDNATTNAIAARAGTSVGVLYKFFPNKQALIEELAIGYAERIESLLGQQGEQGISAKPLDEAVDILVRLIMDFHLEHPAYHHVYRAVYAFSSAQGPLLLERIKRVVGHLLGLRMPAVSVERRELHAMAAVEAAHALAVKACKLPVGEQERLVVETVLMLTRYLTPDYVPQSRENALPGVSEDRSSE